MGTPLPVGSAFRINSVGSFSDGRSVAILKDGTFVVIWIETVSVEIEGSVFREVSSVHGQVFYANGDKLGDEFIVSPPKAGEYSFFNEVHVVALKDGGFAVTYSHFADGDPENSDIWLRVYEADRSASAEVIATQDVPHWQGHPVVAASADGGFTLSYQTTTEAGENPMMVQRYDASGSRMGSSKVVTPAGDMQSLTTLKNGNTVIAYEAYDDAGNSGLRARIYAPDGSEISTSSGITLPSTLDGYQQDPSITALADGRFVAVWTQVGPTSGDASIALVRGRIFTADGNPVGADFQINVKAEGSQRSASVAALPNGGFAVAFEDWDFESDAAVVVAQSIRVVTFGSNGLREGDEIVIATGGPGDVEAPILSALADGRLLLTWSELNQFRESHSAAQVLDPRVESIDWAGSDEEDNYVGTAFDDTLKGLAGKDRLYGNAGSDTLDGGLGADSLDGGAGFDVASYTKAAGGVDVSLANGKGSAGEAAGDALSSVEGLVGSAYDDTLVGDDFANLLKGESGKDNMQGGSGDDKLWGGLGNDQLKGGAGRDAFVFHTKASAKTNKDKIADFKTKDDSIWLDNAVFTKLGKSGTEANPTLLKKSYFVVGSKAKDKNDHIVYNKAKGVLYYDADGSGKGKAVEIATLSKKLAMTYKDFFVI